MNTMMHSGPVAEVVQDMVSDLYESLYRRSGQNLHPFIEEVLSDTGGMSDWVMSMADTSIIVADHPLAGHEPLNPEKIHETDTFKVAQEIGKIAVIKGFPSGHKHRRGIHRQQHHPVSPQAFVPEWAADYAARLLEGASMTTGAQVGAVV